MVEPIDVKDIPLPGEDIHRTIETNPQHHEINIYGKQENSFQPTDDSIPDNSLINKLQNNDQNIISNTPNLLSDVITHHDPNQMLVHSDPKIVDPTTITADVETIIAETAQFIEKNDSALSQIQQQIETVKINEKANTNEAQNISNQPLPQQFEVHEERPLEIVETPQIQTDNEHENLIMEATDESFTLTLNIPDNAEIEEQHEIVPSSDVHEIVETVPQHIEEAVVEEVVETLPQVHGEEEMETQPIENNSPDENTLTIVENDTMNEVENMETQEAPIVEEETIINQEIQIEHVEIITHNEEIEHQIEEVVHQSEEVVHQNEEIVHHNEEIVSQSKEVIHQTEEAVTHSEEIVHQQEEVVPQTEETVHQNEEIVQQSEEIVSQTEEIIDQTDNLLQTQELSQNIVQLETENLQSAENENEVPENTIVASRTDNASLKNEEVVPENVDMEIQNDPILQNEDVTQKAEVMTDNADELMPQSVEVVPQSDEVVPQSDEIVPQSDEIVSQSEESVTAHSEEVVSECAEVVNQKDKSKSSEKIAQSNEIVKNTLEVQVKNEVKSSQISEAPKNANIENMETATPAESSIEEVQYIGEEKNAQPVEYEETEYIVERGTAEPANNEKKEYIVTTGDIKQEIINSKVPVESGETVYVVQELAEPIVVSQKEIIITQNEIIEEAKPKKPEKRVRHEKGTNAIPCHVLGRNVDNPTEDLVSNGRTPPKPRLGVKVPYRHLMSQIVTKQDIANELIEIVSKRNPSPEPPPGGDIFFAQKLTQRLASKIAKNPVIQNITQSLSATVNANLKKNITPTLTKKVDKVDSKKTVETPEKNKAIENKQDLLAILEGDVEVDLAKEVQKGPLKKEADDGPPVLTPENVEATNVKNAGNSPPELRPVETERKRGRAPKEEHIPTEIEKIIALKQLEQFKRRSSSRRKQNLQEQVQTREQLIEPNNDAPDNKQKTNNKKDTPKSKNETANPNKDKDKDENPTVKIEISTEPPEVASTPVAKKKVDKNTTHSQKDEKAAEVDDVPTLTRRKITKTYSRKEPILQVPDDLVKIIDSEAGEGTSEKTKENNEKQTKSKKKEIKKVVKENVSKKAPVTEVVLVSKRARVIKPKVIWDPAEADKKTISPTKKVETKAKTPTKQVEEPKITEDEKPNTPEEKTTKEAEPEESSKETTKKPQEKVTKQMSAIQKKKMLIQTRVMRLRKGLLMKKKSKMAKIEMKKNKKKLMMKKSEMTENLKPKRTELDRLLGDEGAVNMLYNISQNRKNAKSQKEILNRAKLLKDTLTQKIVQEDTPKALRRKGKETPSTVKLEKIAQRKKSRDSIRSSNQSPPPSPSFAFARRAEASRIIRRHSSSSFSSDESDTEETNKEKPAAEEAKMEVEEQKADDKVDKNKTVPAPATKRKSSSDSKASDKTTDKKTEKPTLERLTSAEKRKLSSEMSKNFSQEPPAKKLRSSAAVAEVVEVVETTPVKNTKGNKKTDKLWNEMVKNGQEEKRVSVRQAALADNYKEISIKKIDTLVQIILTSTSTKIKNSINVQMCNELCEVLNKLSKDTSCNAVLFSSIDNNFCNGIDFSVLIQTSKDKKLAEAQEVAKSLKEFLLTLSSFPKPLIVGIQGPALGLGVTMLPAFDLVLASDKATFATPYGHIGQIPEGAVLLNSPHIRGSILTSELIFASRKLTASEALQHGLVTRVLWPDKFQEELILIAQSVAKQSTQCLVATKKLLRQSMLSNLSAALESESKLLVEHWTSAECQQNFKKMLQENEWW